jgi:hypothetical protein
MEIATRKYEFHVTRRGNIPFLHGITADSEDRREPNAMSEERGVETPCTTPAVVMAQ